MGAAERALPDALGTVALYGLAGVWLTSASPSGPALQLAGLASGALVAGAAAGSVLRRIPRFSTPADRVTLLRAVLVALCAVLAVPQLLTGGRVNILLLVLGGIAFLLDGLDGAVARRTGTSSAEGARFDAATDAALVLVLSVASAAVVGPWALGIGAMYYAFVAAGLFLPHLRAALQPRPSRRLIGAYQPFALLASLVPAAPPTVAAAAPAVALTLLLFSFGRDVVELERLRRAELPLAARVQTIVR